MKIFFFSSQANSAVEYLSNLALEIYCLLEITQEWSSVLFAGEICSGGGIIESKYNEN